MNDLEYLSGDPLRHEVRDLDYDEFVGRQFATAYAGNSPVPRANVETVYVPKPEIRFFDLARAVGPGQANTIYDVARAKNALSSLGFARFDLTKERSTQPTPNFFNRIRRAQNALGESIDGIMNPGGATISALGESYEGKRPTGFELGVLKTAAAGRNAALTEPADALVK